MSKSNEYYREQREYNSTAVSFNPTTGEIITEELHGDEALMNATKKQVLRLLKASDFVLINGVYEAKRDGLIKILSSLPISYQWQLEHSELKDVYAKVEGRLSIEVGELKRQSSGLGICELKELKGTGGLHFMMARAETRALKRAIEVLFGSVINYYVVHHLMAA